MNKNSHWIVLLAFVWVFLPACNKGKAVQTGVKVSQHFSKNGSKIAVQTQKLRTIKGAAVIKDGRLIPMQQAKQLKSVSIPNPSAFKNLNTPQKLKSLSLKTSVAQKTVQNTPVRLQLYDATGNAIIYADETAHALVHSAAKQRYQTKVVQLVEKIREKLRAEGKAFSEKDMRRIIKETTDEFLGPTTPDNPVLLDLASGDLQFNMAFSNKSIIVGQVNIYTTVRNGLSSIGGYYLIKEVL